MLTKIKEKINKNITLHYMIETKRREEEQHRAEARRWMYVEEENGSGFIHKLEEGMC